MSSEDKTDSSDAQQGDAPPVKPRHYTETRNQPRVRPQWDPAELARKYLDEMEKGGRLHNRLKRDKPA